MEITPNTSSPNSTHFKVLSSATSAWNGFTILRLITSTCTTTRTQYFSAINSSPSPITMWESSTSWANATFATATIKECIPFSKLTKCWGRMSAFSFLLLDPCFWINNISNAWMCYSFSLKTCHSIEKWKAAEHLSRPSATRPRKTKTWQ